MSPRPPRSEDLGGWFFFGILMAGEGKGPGRTEAGGRTGTNWPSVQIVVAGAGNAGHHGVQVLRDGGLSGGQCLAVDSDWASLALRAGVTTIRLEAGPARGLGAGGRPEVGARAAEDASVEIAQALGRPDLVFVLAGLGGGTGTGAAPVVARLARGTGAVAVAVATLPFTFEGARRRRVAEEGVADLLGTADTLVLIHADALFEMLPKNASLSAAFGRLDEVVARAVRCVSDLFLVEGLLCVDWADARAALARRGLARFGYGEAEGEGRAVTAAQRAVSCPLLGVALSQASGLLIRIAGGPDLALYEVSEALDLLKKAAGPEADLTFGCLVEDAMEGRMGVSMVATGLEAGLCAA